MPDSATPTPPPRPGTGRYCPGCGVLVTAGYPRCPKCHAPMPGAPPTTGKMPKQGRFTAGGTSVAVDDERRSVLPLIIGLGILAVAAVVIYVVARGDGKKAAAGPDPSAEVETEAEGTAEGEAETSPDDPAGARGGEPEENDRKARVERTRITRALATALRTQRLWSSVDLDPIDDRILIIHSQYCGEEGVQAVLADAKSDLVDSGVTMVRCVEQHGPLVFEQAP
jgi:hypothetical protein